MRRPFSPVQQARNDLGAAVRRGDPPEAIADYRRAMTEASIAEWIKRKLAEAPSLTDDQLARLRALLTPAGGGDGQAA